MSAKAIMSTKVVCTELELPWFKVSALAFLPTEEASRKKEWALFTHGYTSHKGDCLNWATRLAEAGVACLIFDQPGHYLGSFNEVSSFKDFQEHAHELFGEAFLKLQNLLESHCSLDMPMPGSLILGGHSLGAFTSMKALELPLFSNIDKVAVGIGIGIGQRQATHLFETAFYSKTLSIRRQLVSPELDPKDVFSWLKESKENMDISGFRIHCITGEDDVVVGNLGLEAMVEVLEKNGNVVTSEKPKRLPHHEPGAAAPHLYGFLKNHFGWA